MISIPQLEYAGRFSCSPVFSLFHTSSQGQYRLLLNTRSAPDMADRYRTEVIKPETVGLEIRVDGIRLAF